MWALTINNPASYIRDYAKQLAIRLMAVGMAFALCISSPPALAGDKTLAKQLVGEMIALLQLHDKGHIAQLDQAIKRARQYWVDRLELEMEDEWPREGSQLSSFSESTFLATVLWFVLTDGETVSTSTNPVQEVVSWIKRLHTQHRNFQESTPDPEDKHRDKDKIWESFLRHYQLGYLSSTMILEGKGRTCLPDTTWAEEIFNCAIQQFWIISPLNQNLTSRLSGKFLGNTSIMGDIISHWEPFTRWLADQYSPKQPFTSSTQLLCQHYSSWLLYLMVIYDVVSEPQNLILNQARDRNREPRPGEGEELYSVLVTGLANSVINSFETTQGLIQYLCKDPLLKQAKGEESLVAYGPGAGTSLIEDGMRGNRLARYCHNMQSVSLLSAMQLNSLDKTVSAWLTSGDMNHLKFWYGLLSISQFNKLMAVRIAGAALLLEAQPGKALEQSKRTSIQFRWPEAELTEQYPRKGLPWPTLWRLHGWPHSDQVLVHHNTKKIEFSHRLFTGVTIASVPAPAIVSAPASDSAPGLSGPTDTTDTADTGTSAQVSGSTLTQSKRTEPPSSYQQQHDKHSNNFQQVFVANINAFKSKIREQMQPYSPIVIQDAYRKDDHVWLCAARSFRHYWYEVVTCSPIGSVHWVKVSQPDGSLELEENYEQLVKNHMPFMLSGQSSFDTAELVFLNSCISELVSIVDPVGDDPYLLVLASDEPMRELKRFGYFFDCCERLDHQDGTMQWTEFRPFHIVEDEQIVCELPLPSNRKIREKAGEEAAMTTNTAIALFPCREQPQPPVQAFPQPLISQPPSNRPDDNQIKRYALEAYDQPSYMFYRSDGEQLGLGNGPLPDEHPNCRLFQEGGNGVILTVDNQKYSFSGYGPQGLLAIKKTAFRWQEILILTKLNHPNVLKLLGLMMGRPIEGWPRRRNVYHFHPLYTKDIGRLVESYERECLRTLLDRYKNEPLLLRKCENNFLHFFTQVASALDYLHNGLPCKIVHRDVKPSNILTFKDCECKSPFSCACRRPLTYILSDFDAAMELGRDGRIQKDQTKQKGSYGYFAQQQDTYHISPVGTLGFKSPEGSIHQVSNDPDILEEPTKMDIYSLGKLGLLALFNEEDKVSINTFRQILYMDSPGLKKQQWKTEREYLVKLTRYGVFHDGEHSAFQKKQALKWFNSQKSFPVYEELDTTFNDWQRLVEKIPVCHPKSRDLVKLIGRCSHANPQDRPPITEVLSELEKIKTSMAVSLFRDMDANGPESLPSVDGPKPFLDTGSPPLVAQGMDTFSPRSSDSGFLSGGSNGAMGINDNSQLWEDYDHSSLEGEQKKKYQEALKQKLADLGLEIVNTPGDGWCLLHAVAIQAGMETGQLAKLIIERLRLLISKLEEKLQQALEAGNEGAALEHTGTIELYQDLVALIQSHQYLPPETVLQEVAHITGAPVTLLMPGNLSGNGPVLATLHFQPESGSVSPAIHVAHTGALHFAAAMPPAPATTFSSPAGVVYSQQEPWGVYDTNTRLNPTINPVNSIMAMSQFIVPLILSAMIVAGSR